jgi:hypothetical protein
MAVGSWRHGTAWFMFDHCIMQQHCRDRLQDRFLMRMLLSVACILGMLVALVFTASVTRVYNKYEQVCKLQLEQDSGALCGWKCCPAGDTVTLPRYCSPLNYAAALDRHVAI